MAKMTNCIKVGDDFVDIIVVAKDGTFMKTDKDLLDRAVIVLRKIEIKRWRYRGD